MHLLVKLWTFPYFESDPFNDLVDLFHVTYDSFSNLTDLVLNDLVSAGRNDWSLGLVFTLLHGLEQTRHMAYFYGAFTSCLKPSILNNCMEEKEQPVQYFKSCIPQNKNMGLEQTRREITDNRIFYFFYFGGRAELFL